MEAEVAAAEAEVAAAAEGDAEAGAGEAAGPGSDTGSESALNGSEGEDGGGDGGDLDDPTMPVMAMDQLQADSPQNSGTRGDAFAEGPLTVPQYEPNPGPPAGPPANPSGASRRGSSSRNLKSSQRNQRRGSNRGGGGGGGRSGRAGGGGTATYEPLLDPTDLNRPGSFSHRNLDINAGTTIQGLIYVPNKGWCLAHAVAALLLSVLGGCEMGYGLSIRSSVTTASYLPYGSCGAWWSGVALLLAGLLAAVTACTFYNITPRRAGQLESSLCSDPRRYLFVLAGIAMIVAACGAFVDGVYPGLLHLQKLDECSDDTFAKYPGCSVDASASGGHACACVDRYVFSASEGHCFNGDDTYGACITCGFNPQASKVKGAEHCVRCEGGYEVDVQKGDCSGYCVPVSWVYDLRQPLSTSFSAPASQHQPNIKPPRRPFRHPPPAHPHTRIPSHPPIRPLPQSGTAEHPLLLSGCDLPTEGDYKCEVFEDVEGSCDNFLPGLMEELETSVWLCCAGVMVSGLLGMLAWCVMCALCGLSGVVCGLWSVVCGLWSVVCGHHAPLKPLPLTPPPHFRRTNPTLS